MNIYDISQKAGVSIATVSRVLNDNPHVSEATRKKVLRVIDQSSFVPNAFARGLGLGSMRSIGLLCPDVSDPYHATALSCLEGAFRRRDYRCILSCVGHTASERAEGIEAMRDQKVDAMVLMGSSFLELNENGDRLLRSVAASLPVAILNGESDIPEVYSVCCDDYKATYEAMQHLIDAGCRHVLYLYHSDNRSGQKKLNGYRDAHRQNGIPLDERLIRFCGQDRDLDHVLEMMQEIETEGVTYDAVMTSEDLLAVAAAKYCRRSGLLVPDDVRIIGYNNLSVCRCYEPEISSVDNHLPWLCEMIADTLVAVLDGQEMPHRQIKPGTLCERASS